MNVLTRVDAYLTNMKNALVDKLLICLQLLRDKEKGADTSIMPIGCAECFVKNKENTYERAWTKIYST